MHYHNLTKFEVIEHRELTIFEKATHFGIDIVEYVPPRTSLMVVVAFSGGRDSNTCLELACQRYGSNNVVAAFADVKNEHPTTYKHVEATVSRLGCGYIKYTAGNVNDEILNAKRFPSFSARFCTSILKLRPAKYIECLLSVEFGLNGFEVWVGIRSDESAARKERYADIADELYTKQQIMPSIYPAYMHERYNIMQRLPIIDWTIDDVNEFLGDKRNPLYETFDSVGCFPCYAAGDKTKQETFSYDAFGQSQWENIKIVAEKIGKPVFTGKKTKGLNDSRCMFCSI